MISTCSLKMSKYFLTDVDFCLLTFNLMQWFLSCAARRPRASFEFFEGLVKGLEMLVCLFLFKNGKKFDLVKLLTKINVLNSYESLNQNRQFHKVITSIPYLLKKSVPRA